jgi:hypothetical protein
MLKGEKNLTTNPTFLSEYYIITISKGESDVNNIIVELGIKNDIQSGTNTMANTNPGRFENKY